MANIHTIKTWKDPYDMGFSPCSARSVTLTQGLNILVGCNGAGKTTLIENIKSQLKDEKVPFVAYDNLTNGGLSNATNGFNFDARMLANLVVSSEGERISLNIGKLVSGLRHFVITGQTSKNRSVAINTNERWLLFDAVDSGYSIDNVLEFKSVMEMIAKDALDNGINLYIIVSANSYEMAAGEKCIDVMTGKPVEFTSYDEYKKFIMRTREKKDRKLKKARENNE